MTARLLVAANGHGEDDIACKIVDALRARAPAVEIIAWPMVGRGHAFADRRLTLDGPANLLPSEGFGTVSAGNFLRDLRAGFLGTYLSQLRHARRQAGRYDLILAVGDVVPLCAGALAKTPMVYVSCAKSSYYGPKTDHDRLDRWLMRRRAVEVFPRDRLTADRLHAHGIAATDAGNPMMDGLEAKARLVEDGQTGIVMLAGSRRDAPANASDLLEGAGVLATRNGAMAKSLRFLFAAPNALDADAITPGPGWDDIDPGQDARRLRHTTGAEARIVKGRFADVLASGTLAVGMAGTANEQAIGVGLPLVNLPGRGNQGEAFWRMKTRYYGDAAIPAQRAAPAMATAMQVLLDDPDRRAAMARAGAERMGPPGASARIAEAVIRHLGVA